MERLFSLKFWFNSRPGALMPEYQRYFIIFIVILAILTFIAFILQRRQSNIYKKALINIYYFFLANTVFSLIILWFTYEAIPFLSSRLWFLLLVLEMLVWAFFIVKRLKEIPKRKQAMEKEREFKKYIP